MRPRRRLGFQGRRQGSVLLLAALLFFSQSEAFQGVTLRQGVEDLAQEIIKNLPSDRLLIVAVTEFPDLQGAISDLSGFIAERLTTVLSLSPQIAVVERRRLDLVLAEFGWNHRDLFDPEKATRIRQMVGVNSLLIGTLADLGSALEIEARLVALETGYILKVAMATIPKDQTVGTLMGKNRWVLGPPARPQLPTLPSEDAALPAEMSTGLSIMYSTPGARWKYEFRVEHEEGLFFKRKVSQQGSWTLLNEGEVSFMGSKAFKLKSEHRIGTSVSRESYYYHLSDQTIRQVGAEEEYSDGQRAMAIFEPPMLLWRAGGKPGDRWEAEFRATVQGKTSSASAEMVSTTPGGATINLNVLLGLIIESLFATLSSSGERTNVVKVLVGPVERISIPLWDFDSQRLDFHRGALVIADWYVPAIGLAKRTVLSPKIRSVAELLEFFIPQ